MSFLAAAAPAISAVSGVVGAIGSLGGNKGMNSQAQQANLTPVVSQAQLDEQYRQSQEALKQQQAFLQATQAQNGLGKQQDVYGQFGNVAAGQGPNPAQAMLANSTGQNVAAQNAMMAGQRGAGANVGLLARQAAMQGANTQQQAIGQGAALQAQQSLQAMGQQANMANTMAAQQAAATGANTQAAQQGQQNVYNAATGQNQARVANMQQANAAQAPINKEIADAQIKGLGGLGQSLGAAADIAGGWFKKKENPSPLAGGEAAIQPQVLPGMDNANTVQAAEGGMIQGPRSSFGQFLTRTPAPVMAPNIAMAEGGQVPALVSPGEIRIHRDQVPAVAKGKLDPIESGEKIKGKAKVGGAKNSYANDTVPKTLNEGDIILPRSVTQSKNPHWAAHKFVSEIMAKKGKLPSKR